MYRGNRARINISPSVGIGITESVLSNIIRVVFAFTKNVGFGSQLDS